ncbi:MAG: EamA family transporter [Anaerolineae bacterium]|nr:EamA family transporter [Anaerolineae bacterium]
MIPAALDRRKAILFLIIAAVLWSTSGIFLKTLNWQPLAVLAGRSLFSSLVFLVYLRRIPRRFTRWQWVAALSSVLTQLLYITAIQMTTAANAIFLQYTAPIYILLLGYWLLREKPSKADWVAMLVIFAGLGLFFGDRLSPGGFTGNLLAIISGVTMALMTVAMRAQKDGSPAESFLLANLLGMLLGGYFVFQQPWTIANWGSIAYLGIFQIGLAFLLYSLAIKVIPALEATLIGTLEPILNPLWVFLLLGEMPGPLALLGGLVVLAGVVISSIASARAEQE